MAVKKASAYNEPTFYVIRHERPTGFFFNFFLVLGELIYAGKKKYIPIVDMKYYPTTYNEDEPVNGTRNSWEYYFEPVSQYSVDQIKDAKNKLQTNGSLKIHMFNDLPTYIFHRRPPTPKMVANLQKVMKRYIRLKPYLLAEFDQLYAPLRNERLLGVHYRGTDMRQYPNQKPPAKLADVLRTTIQEFKNGGYDKVFIASDEEAAVEAFKKVFSERRLVVSGSYRSSKKDFVGLHSYDKKSYPRPNHKYLLGKEVLFDALVLSKCKSLICGHSNVSYGAIVFNDNRYDKIIYTND